MCVCVCVCAWFELEAVGWVGVLRTTATATATNEILEQVAKAECSIPSPIVVLVVVFADFETFPIKTAAAAAPTTTSGDQIN